MTQETSGNALACIGETHGYLFDGDSVQINAELNFSDAALGAASQWALQLWSSVSGFPDQQLAGVKVAELAVYPAAGYQSLAATVAATPPAGSDEQNVALALVFWDENGQPTVADMAVYPLAESFVQPKLAGNLSVGLADGLATIKVDAIENPRAEDNLSGTLALELWALDAPYAGGSWQGIPVASVILGVLGGGNSLIDSHFVVPAAAPEGPGVLTLMLREWGPLGYVTRDYCNLSLEAPAKAKPKAAAKKAIAKEEAPKAKSETKPAADKVKKTKSADKAPAKAKAAAIKGIAINAASEAELLAIKGLTATVAKAIVAGRPYAALNELGKVKGVGPKLLATLRDKVVL
ncbi:MAG: helix-hairpin-helix domain-containing protein [Gammaproteobacteria bacterium]|nr:helix-hairpin-helix domain-containing protein [Gammaproteobacteria bacterium]MBU1602792.1 helix-hairpin-helix domain-containing protein [Gammaproteobacteria bacterium]MBU2432464.1 helix-hairpin-helix domain-containing protein [Gammaproteobacteria bacterium]MBU2448993.1 helix-hairpin-helix domain-containing protein [Gammaproteobacteria bacterium]